MRRSVGFTLIELLVVIAIIAVLAAILFPVFAQAKAAAKRTTDVSNVKQIALGVTLYAGDADDCPPLAYIVTRDEDWNNKGMTSWKDLTLPYIKSVALFESPIADAPWSNVAPTAWDFPPMEGKGDLTTRFPRSYAVTIDAGQNDGINGMVFGMVEPHWTFSGSPITALGNTANTILTAPTRTSMLLAGSYMLAARCTRDGNPSEDQPTSCIQGAGNKGANFSFFDGHAKNVRAVETVTKDLWGSFAEGERSNPGSQQSYAAQVGKIEEWR